jgi:hypothetical protein
VDWRPCTRDAARVVLTSFMFSPEFATFTKALFGSNPVRYEIDMVMDFYRGFLSRLPDADGFAYWLEYIRTAQCAGPTATATAIDAMSRQFTSSPEYLTRSRSNAQIVADLYNALLRRGGEQSGVQYWIGQLDNAVQTQESVRQQFLATSEFRGRVDALIAQGCIL